MTDAPANQPPPPPPLPLSLKRALRGFSTEQITEARKTLSQLAQSCPDFRTRKEAAEYIDKAARVQDEQFFAGDEAALEQLAALPVERRSAAALQLFAKQAISRPDLDMILKSVAADQTAKLADMEMARIALERENKDLVHQLRHGKLLDGTTE